MTRVDTMPFSPSYDGPFSELSDEDIEDVLYSLTSQERYEVIEAMEDVISEGFDYVDETL
jgi:hypothetical protein